MANYSNQKTVKSVTLEPCNKNNLYATISIKALNNASKDLTLNELRVWLYFSCNKESYRFDYSTQDVVNKFGGTLKNIKLATHSLIKKGYLVEKGNELSFYQGGRIDHLESECGCFDHLASDVGGRIDLEGGRFNREGGRIDPSNITDITYITYNADDNTDIPDCDESEMPFC